MSDAGAIREQHSGHETHDDDGATSGVFERRPSFGIAMGIPRSHKGDHGPAPVYAVPFLVLGHAHVPYPECYYLGTHFEIGMIPAVDWEDAMRADGLPEAMIGRCRAYVEKRAIQ